MSDTSAPHPNRFLNWLGKRWVGVGITALFLIFFIQNIALVNSIEISLLWITVQSPIWVLVILLFGAGAIAGSVFARNREKQRLAAKK